MSDLESFADTWVDAFNAHDRERIAANFAGHCVIEAPGDVRIEGKDGCVAYAMGWLEAFSDARTVEHTRVVAEPWIARRFTFEGTHDGTLHGPAGDVPPTGRRVSGRGVELIRVADGAAVEFQLYFDQVQLMSQLGLMPEPATA